MAVEGAAGHVGFWVLKFKFKVKMIVVGASSSKAPKAAAVKSRAKSKAWIFFVDMGHERQLHVYHAFAG